MAWNRDGTAALLEHRTYWDGDTSLGYSIVSAGAKPVAVAISQTLRADGMDVEQIARTDCTNATVTLASALAARHFDGVMLVADQCNHAERRVLVVGADATRAVEQSWVALPQGRPATAREEAAWAAAKQAVPEYSLFAPSEETCSGSGHRTVDIAAKSEQLVLVFTLRSCDSPIKELVHAFAGGKEIALAP